MEGSKMNKEGGRSWTSQKPVKYGDIFPHVSGKLARQAVNPQDAAMMQSAENKLLGQTQKGGPAAVMQSAATHNELAGLVGHDGISSMSADKGVTVTETDVPGTRIITEKVGGHVVKRFLVPAPVPSSSVARDIEALTIGEALEATAVTIGNKPVEQSDASAIQAAEARATGVVATIPSGIGAAAQAAADHNKHVTLDDEKTKIADVLKNSTKKLPADKAATREDAHKIVSAEMRNSPDMSVNPTGVSASVTAAARLNQSKRKSSC
ncbi:Seed maturation protein/ Late embryogenesis abundant protein [Zostera marina]|uniref:Seed maturation protein/ Late embryogenesis abundant protein n=1 Tax=Zostera marina TaxID=29655 RepID=A0A0K9PC32_ZOSMR|nr:Seed maturation protein/ Late embryogenesis abundant protein [Zostera marina]